MVIPIKIKSYILAISAGLIAALFFALKFISIGKQTAKAETLEAQRKIEDRAVTHLKQEVLKSNDNVKQNDERIARADFSGFNDSD